MGMCMPKSAEKIAAEERAKIKREEEKWNLWAQERNGTIKGVSRILKASLMATRPGMPEYQYGL